MGMLDDAARTLDAAAAAEKAQKDWQDQTGLVYQCWPAQFPSPPHELVVREMFGTGRTERVFVGSGPDGWLRTQRDTAIAPTGVGRPDVHMVDQATIDWALLDGQGATRQYEARFLLLRDRSIWATGDTFTADAGQFAEAAVVSHRNRASQANVEVAATEQAREPRRGWRIAKGLAIGAVVVYGTYLEQRDEEAEAEAERERIRDMVREEHEQQHWWDT